MYSHKRMDNIPSFFTMNATAHFMEPGTIAFVPGWIILLITIFTFSILFPRVFPKSKKEFLINPYLLAFIIGSLMPVFDDLFPFVFGKPFAHHSLFHSLIGVGLTFLIFRIFSTTKIAKYAFGGNLAHIFFNFYLDRVTLLFPFTYQEWGLTDLTAISTYWLKVINYPIIFLLFAWAIIRFFLNFKHTSGQNS